MPDRAPDLTADPVPAHAERQILAHPSAFLDGRAVEKPQQAVCAGALHDVLGGVHVETPVLQWRRHHRSSFKAQPANNLKKKFWGRGWRFYRHRELNFGG